MFNENFNSILVKRILNSNPKVSGQNSKFNNVNSKNLRYQFQDFS